MRSLLHGGPHGAAYAAALGLVAIQVGIGIIIKLAQKSGGEYAFSPSASVAISEFLKMCLSCAFFWRECQERAARGIRPKSRAWGGNYAQLPTARTGDDAERNSLEDKEGTTSSSEQQHQQSSGDRSGTALPLSRDLYWNYIKSEVSAETRFGFCNLALFYVLINNSIFVSYKMADPGTIQLTKSAVTFITAVVMIATLRARVSKIQWVAIVLQLCGLIVTQYDPETGMNYPLGTYLILIFQTFLSASSGVYNQVLLKREKSSLHANNLTLYAAGAFFNIVVHNVVCLVNPDEPGFFVGYDSFGALMVIASNVFIGLAITAVYKYADAVIKCFATAVATGILLYLSPILFGTHLGFLALPGTLIVFVASWLYMDNPAPRDDAPDTRPSIMAKPAAVMAKFPKTVLGVSTFATIITIAWLTASEVSMPGVKTSSPKAGGHAGQQAIVESPFKNSLAMVRWNSAHPERVPWIRKYEPFFHTVHISMPQQFADKDASFYNLTHDQYSGIQTHNQVASMMQLLLDEHPDVDGLLYFHFDAWIDPLRFGQMNFSHIWYIKTGFPLADGPPFRCMKEPDVAPWWGWNHGFHERAREASAVASSLPVPAVPGASSGSGAGRGYTVEPNEFCLGWSDIYWVPRRFFNDYISLTRNAFGGSEDGSVFHEVAVPTMLHIIDQTWRRTRWESLMDHLGECWGSCCATNPRHVDVSSFRCGHKLEYRDEAVTSTFYNNLDSEARLLGKPVP